tara:strand:- start:2827 stop:5460 length:2634 start_codon:yes stop_codon:yes gene_type:complete
MKKIYTLTAACILSASAMAQQVYTLQQPTKLNLTPKAKLEKGLNGQKNTESFLQQDFQAADALDAYTLDMSLTSMGWELDSSRISDALFIPELNDTANGEAMNIFAVSNDSKNEILSGSNDASMDYISLPSIDFTAVKEGVILQFDFFANDMAATAVAAFDVEVSTDGGTVFTSVFTPTIGTEWQKAYVDLSAYADETDVIIRFSHNDGAGTESAFAIDNLDIRSLETDLTLTVLPNHSFTGLTVQQNRDITFSVNVANNGLKDESAVVLAGTITDPIGGVTNYDLTFALGAEKDTNLTFGPFTAVEMGDYDINFTIDAGTEETTDDNAFAYTTNLNDSILFRDNGELNTTTPIGNNVDVGVGIPGNLLITSRYSFVAEDTITGVQFAFAETAAAGDEVQISFYGPDGAGGIDFTNILDFEFAQKTEAIGTAEFVTVAIGTGGIYMVDAGDTIYAVIEMEAGVTGVVEMGADSTGLNVDGTSELMFFIPQFGLSLPFGITDAPILRLETKSVDLGDVVADLELSELKIINGFAVKPINQVTEMKITLDVDNIDLGDAEATSVVFNIDEDVAGNVFTKTDDLGTVASGRLQTLSYFFTPSAVGLYTISATISTTSDEDSLANNTIELQFEISDSVLTRFDGIPASALLYGIADLGSGSDTAEAGTAFSMVEADTITAIQFAPNPTFTAGDKFYGHIYNSSDEIVASTEVVTAAADAAGLTIVRLEFDELTILPVGDYSMEVGTIQADPTAGRSMLMSDGLHTDGTEYIRYLGNKLVLSDQGFSGAYAIFAEFGAVSTVGINETTGAIVSLFPNPATDVLNISNAANSNYVLMNVTGKTVATGSINDDKHTVDVSAFKSGVYVLKLTGTVNESSRIIID